MDWKEWLKADNQEKSNIRSKRKQQEKEKENSLLILIKKLKHLDKQISLDPRITAIEIQLLLKYNLTLKDSKAVQTLIELRDKIEDVLWSMNCSKAISFVINRQCLAPYHYEREDYEIKDRGWEIARDDLARIDSYIKQLFKNLKEEVVPILIELYKSYGENEQKFAEEALQRLREEWAVEPLIAALKDDNWQIRKKVVWSLGEIKDTRATEPLIQTLNDEYNVVRMEAIGALGRIRDKRAVKPLIELLEDSHYEVRFAAIGALGWIGDKRGDKRAIEVLTRLLEDKDKYVTIEAIEALGRIRDKRAVETLVKLLEDKDKDIKTAAMRGLWSSGEDIVVNSLIKLMNDSDMEIQCEAIFSQRHLKDDRAVDPLIRILKDECQDVRIKCIEYWETRRDRILGIKRKGEFFISQEYRLHCPLIETIVALGEIGNQKAVEPLMKILTNNNINIREEYAWALTFEEEEETIVKVLEILRKNESNLNDKKIALQSIGIKDQDVITKNCDSTPSLGKNEDDILKWYLYLSLTEEYIPYYFSYRINNRIIDALEKLGDYRIIKPLELILETKKNVPSNTLRSAIRGLKRKTINDIIREESKQGSYDVKIIKEKAKEKNIDEDFVDKVLEELRSTGELYSPRDGYVKLL
jgi:HEAT repeat protein